MTVLVGELASQFPVIQHQIDDPFLVGVCVCVCVHACMHVCVCVGGPGVLACVTFLSVHCESYGVVRALIFFLPHYRTHNRIKHYTGKIIIRGNVTALCFVFRRAILYEAASRKHQSNS